MSVRLLIDMNLSPDWVQAFAHEGYHAMHWSTVEDPRAPDTVIMTYARENRLTVFTHDLDFGTLLALTHASGPSVLQVRGQNVLPSHLALVVVLALRQYEVALELGALVIVEASKTRVRVLPL